MKYYLFSAVFFLGCGQLSCDGLSPQLGINHAEAAPRNEDVDDESSNETDHDLDIDDQDELPAEDQEALNSLISDLSEQGKNSQERVVVKTSEYERHELVPIGTENWKLSGKQCANRLKKAGVKTKSAGFKTPLVGTPLLLTGPIAGVTIKPRWRKKKPTNEVMDCHLILALVDLAHRAHAMGITTIEYYSTYRPLSQPPAKCAKGKKGKRCRAKKKKYKKTIKGKLSQHRRALAIDIRWLTLEDGTLLDVLEDYDRKDKVAPCSYVASDTKGKLLQELACGLHKDQVFNVILTPNANKAHHNHFHFDISPNATWHVAK